MPTFYVGKQELLILLIDSSASMYVDDKSNPSNKYKQVQSSVVSLLERINTTDKANHILVSLILFSERTLVVGLKLDKVLYQFSRDWLKANKINEFFKEINPPNHSNRIDFIGEDTSILEGFISAKEVCASFMSDQRIAPENRIGVSIMLFSDGNDNVNSNILARLETIKKSLIVLVSTNIVLPKFKDNLSIGTIAIGRDAEAELMNTISTVQLKRQMDHIERLRESNKEARSRIDGAKCYLKLDARNNSIDDIELEILRKFLFLVTGTPL